MDWGERHVDKVGVIGRKRGTVKELTDSVDDRVDDVDDFLVCVDAGSAVDSASLVKGDAKRFDGGATCSGTVEKTCANADSLDFSEVVGSRCNAVVSASESAVSRCDFVTFTRQLLNAGSLGAAKVADRAQRREDLESKAVVAAPAGRLEGLDGLLDVGVTGDKALPIGLSNTEETTEV